MKKIVFWLVAAVMATGALAQGTLKKVRLYEGDQIIFERNYIHVDSVVFVDVPDATLNGAFSVSATKKVHFAKGNLQATYDGTSWSWDFAANTWEYIGDAAANNAITGNGTASTYGTVDLFGWSSAATYYGIHNGSNNWYFRGTFIDWGEVMGEGWFTLSKEEWMYLYLEREKADELFGFGTVNGVNGTILLPDEWTVPEGVAFNSAKDKGVVWNSDGYYYNGNYDNFTQNTYSAAQWAVMEEAGAVFLPAAGNRYTTSVNLSGTDGYYWSSTMRNENNANFLNFSGYNLDPEIDFSLYSAKSVRLVRVVE